MNSPTPDNTDILHLGLSFEDKPIKSNLTFNMKSKFKFLESTRFWSLVLGAIVVYLKTKGYIGEAEMLLINTILGGHIVINTLDKNIGEAKVESAKVSGSVTTVTIPESVSSVSASTEK